MKTFKHYITEEDNPRIPRKKGQPAIPIANKIHIVKMVLNPCGDISSLRRCM